MEQFIERDIIKSIQKHLDNKEITLITGARRSGKTTILNYLIEYLKDKRHLYLNLDIEEDKKFFQSQKSLLDRINFEFGTLDKIIYLFIDEIQRKENAGLFLKGIYDLDLPIKIITTGSGSLELKEKIHESLAGRKRIFQVNTLSFNEFVNFKNHLTPKQSISDFAKVFPDKIYQNFEEYLTFGGYPQVVLAQTTEEKIATLSEIYSSYVSKDIKNLLNIERTSAFHNLIKVLANKSGNLISKSSIAKSIGVSQGTVDTYLWYLEQTFIIKLVYPYFTNARIEISKSPVVYFMDLGIKSMAEGNFNTDLNTKNGFAYENFIFRKLFETQTIGTILNYWRSNTGAEVDFVTGTRQNPIPVEVKMQYFKDNPKFGKSFYSFLEKYQPKQAYLYNLDTTTKNTIKNTLVETKRFFEGI